MLATRTTKELEASVEGSTEREARDNNAITDHRIFRFHGEARGVTAVACTTAAMDCSSAVRCWTRRSLVCGSRAQPSSYVSVAPPYTGGKRRRALLPAAHPPCVDAAQRPTMVRLFIKVVQAGNRAPKTRSRYHRSALRCLPSDTRPSPPGAAALRAPASPRSPETESSSREASDVRSGAGQERRPHTRHATAFTSARRAACGGRHAACGARRAGRGRRRCQPAATASPPRPTAASRPRRRPRRPARRRCPRAAARRRTMGRTASAGGPHERPGTVAATQCVSGEGDERWNRRGVGSEGKRGARAPASPPPVRGSARG